MDINQLIESKKNILPGPIKDILNDISILDQINTLGENYGFDEISCEMLAEEVALVLIGENSLAKFKENLIWNLLLKEKKADQLYDELMKLVFNQVIKFISKEKISSGDIKNINVSNNLKTINDNKPEDLNHHDILKEIEAPSPSLKTTITQNTIPTQNSVPALQTMPKEVQKLMGTDANITETTKAPSLQDAVGNMMPPIGTVGGFKPVDNPLKPAEKVASTFDSKLQEVVKTPVKEVYLPKKPDPYRESIE
jgi:hypothetical protein